MSTQLRIARGLSLPSDFVTKTCAILAQRRKGKTYTGAVLAEEIFAAGLPFVALDPTGAWWGLRSSANGQQAGLPVTVIGGEHGDVPLEPTAGKVIADLVVDEPGYYVLDLSLSESKAEHVRFATAFLERLYRRKATSRDVLHLFVDEADEFAPQRPGPDETKMLAAMEAIVRRGGIRGLGTTLITQRAAVLNKNVLTQLDLLIVLRVIGPQDRAAIDEYVKAAGTADQRAELLGSLASLDLGEAWVWEPGAEPPLYERVQIRERRTYNSSATPKPGERRVEPRKLADVDLDVLRRKMAETIERAKENDPGELRRKIKRLETDLAKRPAATETVEVEKIIEVPALREADVEEIGRQVERLFGLRDEILAALHDAAGAAAVLLEQAQQVQGRPSQPAPAQRPARPAPTPRAPRPQPTPRSAASDTTVSSSQQRILDALAWFEWVGVQAPSRAALAPMAKSKPTSGGFKNNLGALRTAGLIDYPQPNRVQLTDTGRALAAPVDGDPTDEALQEAVLAAVTGSQANILRALIAVFPAPLSRDELADQVGVPTTSGGFKNNLGALRTLELIDYPEPGYVGALPVLFPVSHGGTW